jgi:protein-S-isoprenylcysteine O-methyltransferase Ste14
MHPETPFRSTLLAVFVLTMAVIVYHRVRAATPGEKLDRRQEGLALAIVLRLSGLALWIAAFTYLISPDRVAWAQVSLPAWLRWTGAAIGLACAPLMLWTLSSLGKNLTDTVVTRAAATLVTQGPYRYVRHPFYVVAALLMASAALLSANPLVAIPGLMVVVLLAIRTPIEEQKLLERFGDDYRAYMRRTGRFLPRLRG